MRHALHVLMGHEVDVDAIDATFTGILREVTEEDVTLWSSLGWLSIPHARIKGIRPTRKKQRPNGR